MLYLPAFFKSPLMAVLTYPYARFRLRGIRHLVFYSLPLYHEFYPELVNQLEGAGATVTVLFSRYDSHALGRVVGSGRAKRMVAAEDGIHMLVTGTQ